MKNSNTEQKLSLNELIKFESTLKVELPDDFKKFYLENNGGFPPFNCVEGEEYIVSIDGFLPIKYGNLTIEIIINDSLEGGINFNDRVPFANDSSGNIFLIDTNGKVYLWDINEEFLKENLIVIKNTFTEFLNSMIEDYEDEEY